MSPDAAHQRWWQISELVFGIPFLAAIALQQAVPLAFPWGALAPVVVALGAALVVAGVALIVMARREFARYGQSTEPGHPTSAIVTSGVFAFSRNPLYLGAVCLVAGIALALNLPWVLALLVPSIIACHYILIAPEERYLAAKFGETYGAYAASVNRWIGRRATPR